MDGSGMERNERRLFIFRLAVLHCMYLYVLGLRHLNGRVLDI